MPETKIKTADLRDLPDRLKRLSTSSDVVRVKALEGDGEEPGTFEALVAVFGNVDSQGDVVEPGAFTATLAEGLPKLCWSHDWSRPPIGVVLEAEETAEGLWVKARLFIDSDPLAAQIYGAMKAKDGRGKAALDAFSWSGRVKVYEIREDEDGDVTWHLKEIDLREVGPCLVGANSEAHLIDVKSEPSAPAAKTAADTTTTSPQDPDPDAVKTATRSSFEDRVRYLKTLLG